MGQIVQFVGLLLISSHLASAQDCPRDSFYVDEIAQCIHPDNDLSPMPYAELYCQAFGGHLLSIHNAFWNALITGIQLTRLNETRGLLGARRLQNGTFAWSDGTPFDYARWAPGEPLSGDCIYLDSNDYMWRTIDCSMTLPYLCGWPNVTVPDCTTPAPDPISCPQGSVYIQETQSCLHADNNVVSFYLAEKYCQAFNGHLFSLHDGDTDDFLTGISYTLINGDQFYIGAKKAGSNYSWTDGSPLDYMNWGQAEPQRDCVVIQRETTSWVTVDCSTPLPFMCNIPPILNGGCALTTVPFTTTSDELVTGTEAVDTTTTAPAPACPALPALNCLPKESQPLYTCQKGWQCFAKTGYLYLIFTDSSFSKGEAYCVSQGGHLASIHSQEEDDFVSSLCCDSDCNYRKDGPDGWKFAGSMLIGAHKINGAWTWTDGTPWDYSQQICTEGGSDFLVTTDDDCTGDCGEGFGGWVTADPPDAEAIPYFVCKKPNV